jgi:hypothetical protein
MPQIFVEDLLKRYTGVVTLQVEGSDSIKDLKLKIWDKTGIPADQQRLVQGPWVHKPDSTLHDDNTVASYNIQKEEMLKLAGFPAVFDPAAYIQQKAAWLQEVDRGGPAEGSMRFTFSSCNLPKNPRFPIDRDLLMGRSRPPGVALGSTQGYICDDISIEGDGGAVAAALGCMQGYAVCHDTPMYFGDHLVLLEPVGSVGESGGAGSPEEGWCG